MRWVTPGLFATLHIPLKSGRLFTDFDTKNTVNVVVIDDRLAQQYWPNEDPIGKQIQRTDGTALSRIVGVVGHVKTSIPEAGSGRGVVYVPIYQNPLDVLALVIRSDADPAGLVNPMKEAVSSIDPALPVYGLKTMDELVALTLGVRRFAAVLLGIFASIALFMAAIGLYGVINYTVTQRTQEIGIRVALGADPTQVLGFIMKQGLRTSLVGVGLGLIAALAAARLISSQLFGVHSFDPPTFALMAAVLVVVATIAAYIPARRATKIDPLEACRYE